MFGERFTFLVTKIQSMDYEVEVSGIFVVCLTVCRSHHEGQDKEPVVRE